MDYPVSRAGQIKTHAEFVPASAAAPEAIDRFAVLRLLGRGGMGEVFLSRHPVTGVEVAVKRLKPELVGNPDAVHRFLAEARHMYHLNHPRLLRVMEVAHPADGPYLVTPYMPAGSLASKLRPGEPADAELTLRLALDIAEAVSFAHSRGIIHRDLKPANILLDQDGRAYLSDFGLVGEFTTNDSVSDAAGGACEGTVPYMSPAVARGEAEDTRCDIYSFGVVLYEMLTGQLPYGPTHSREKIIAGAPPGVLQQNPHAPRPLAKVADACMARELRDRYAHMNDVLVDLRRVSAGKSPLGPRGSAAGERRWSAILALSAVLAGLTATPLWFLRDRLWWRPEPVMPSITASGPQAPHEVDLLAQVDIGRDVSPPAAGEWVSHELHLACPGDPPRTSLVLPSLPQGDYDLRIEFTRLVGDDGLDHILNYHGGGFVWTLAGDLPDGTTSSFWRVGAGGFGSNPTATTAAKAITNGVRHVSLIKVRNGLVTPSIDGVEAKPWRAEFGELSFPRSDEIPDLWHGRLGLSILKSRWIIHSIRLVENAR